jgi:hypothetical protein
VEEWRAHGGGPAAPHGLDLPGLIVWARELAAGVERGGEPVDAAARAPRLRGGAGS